jgi:hypothetical protein
LQQAAIDAVKQWQYRPYLLNGVPTEVQTTVTVNFALPTMPNANRDLTAQTSMPETSEKAVNPSNATSMVNLADMYARGYGGVTQNYAMARSWLEKAVLLDDPEAMDLLASYYINGQGGPQDYGHARTLYTRALGITKDPFLKELLSNELQQLDKRLAATPQPPTFDVQLSAPQVSVTVAQTQQQDQSTETDNSERIAQLQMQAESDDQEADSLEESANELARNANCNSGPGAAVCEMIGNAGAAKQRKDANKARNEADRDREEIQRLQGEDVTAHQRRTTSFGDTFTQAVSQPSEMSPPVSYPPPSRSTSYPGPANQDTAPRVQPIQQSQSSTSTDFKSCRFVTSLVSVYIRNLSAVDSSCAAGTHPALADWTNRTGKPIECKWTLNEAPGVNVNDYQATGVNDLRCVRNPSIRFVCYDAEDESHSDCMSATP